LTLYFHAEGAAAAARCLPALMKARDAMPTYAMVSARFDAASSHA